MPKRVFAPLFGFSSKSHWTSTLFRLINFLHLGFILACCARFRVEMSVSKNSAEQNMCLFQITDRKNWQDDPQDNGVQRILNHRNTASISISVLGWLALEALGISRWLKQKKASVLMLQKHCKYQCCASRDRKLCFANLCSQCLKTPQIFHFLSRQNYRL